MESNRFIYNFFAKIVDRYIETYYDSYERIFLDVYIKEIRKAEARGTTGTTFLRAQLVMSLLNFCIPAFTGLGTAISLLIQHLLLHPKVLKKVQKEIDEVVCSGRLPTLDDRQYLHYTEATLRESLRLESLIPLDIPHRALRDTELLGYKIPKDTVLMPSFYSLHMDKTIWEDPETFWPERFLNEQGELWLKKDVTLPFGAGKRICAGETFARNTIFLITTALCQNFDFVLGPGDKMPDISKNCGGIITSPPNFWLQMQERK